MAVDQNVYDLICWTRYRVLLLTFLIACQTSASDRTLKLTHVLYRHGNRSPTHGYPTDPYHEDSWPQGFGQLTQDGMLQLYALGQWLHTRYMKEHQFLNSTYMRSEIYIRSTGYDRTLMSAESCLAGLYPPSGRQLWNKQLGWQPIPIFMKPKADDMLLHMEGVDCPRRKELYLEAEKLRDDYIKKDKGFFDNIAKLAGFDIDKATFHNFTRIADAFNFELADNRKLPNWATTDIVNRILPLLDFNYESEVALSDEYFKLTSGKFLNEVVTHFKNKVAGTDETKMYMYSAHNGITASLQLALRILNNRNPPPSSCLLIELYQESDKSYTVDVLFRNDSRKAPIKLQMPGTSGRCTLEHFIKITEPLLLSDVAAACKAQNTHHGGGFLPNKWNAAWMLVAGTSLLAVLAAIIMVLCLFISIQHRAKLIKARRMQPVNLRLLGHTGTDSEDESIFDT